MSKPSISTKLYMYFKGKRLKLFPIVVEDMDFHFKNKLFNYDLCQVQIVRVVPEV